MTPAERLATILAQADGVFWFSLFWQALAAGDIDRGFRLEQREVE